MKLEEMSLPEKFNYALQLGLWNAALIFLREMYYTGNTEGYYQGYTQLYAGLRNRVQQAVTTSFEDGIVSFVIPKYGDYVVTVHSLFEHDADEMPHYLDGCVIEELEAAIRISAPYTTPTKMVGGFISLSSEQGLPQFEITIGTIFDEELPAHYRSPLPPQEK